MRHYAFSDAAVVLAGSKAAREYFEPIFVERDHEIALIGLCDGRLRLVQLLTFPGTSDSCEIPLRQVATAINSIECAGFIMAHNHPSGYAEPSESDLKFARRLLDLAEALDVEMLDFLIFARGNMASFRRSGLL